MSNLPARWTNFEDYLDHEIRTLVVGPVKTNPQNPSCNMAHYVATFAVFRFDKEIEGTKEALQGHYAEKDYAENAAFSRGRQIVDRIMAL